MSEELKSVEHNKQDLVEFRGEIDKIDGKIMLLLAERMETVRKIAGVKKILGAPPLDADRWGRVLESIRESAKESGFDEKAAKEIFEIIHRISLKEETQILEKE